VAEADLHVDIDEDAEVHWIDTERYRSRVENGRHDVCGGRLTVSGFSIALIVAISSDIGHGSGSSIGWRRQCCFDSDTVNCPARKASSGAACSAGGEA
jgi:hypothetical protein